MISIKISCLLVFILFGIIVFQSKIATGKVLFPVEGVINLCGNPVISDTSVDENQDEDNLIFSIDDSEKPRIIGGTVANTLAWPWQALFRIFSTNSSGTFTSNCGATLLNKEWLLTAAHCIDRANISGLIFLGIKSRSDAINRIGRSVSKFIKHEDHNSTTQLNDIALIKLAEPIQQYSDSIKPACLSDIMLAETNRTSTITGWGLTSRNPDTRPENLMQVDVPIVDRRQCRFSNSPPLTTSQLCLGVRGENSKGACSGDSGGPLVIKSGSVWYVAGVASLAGTACNFFSVYTSVFSYNDWILKTIERNI